MGRFTYLHYQASLKKADVSPVTVFVRFYLAKYGFGSPSLERIGTKVIVYPWPGQPDNGPIFQKSSSIAKWKLKSPEGERIGLRFEGAFALEVLG